MFAAVCAAAPAAWAQVNVAGGTPPAGSVITPPTEAPPVVVPPTPVAPAPALAPPPMTGGVGYGAPMNPAMRLTIPGVVAVVGPDGFARAPELAPPAVKEAIWAANEIQGKPYVWGGGHALKASVSTRGFDCSGTVSYALMRGGLLDTPMDSSTFMHWGHAGKGAWVTVYTNPGHAWMVIAGLRLDTSAASDPRGTKGPRWRPALLQTHGYHRRHPDGF